MVATTRVATTAAAGAATTSAPQEPARGRPTGAAAARSEQLYALHHRMVAGLCRALLRDGGEAEDAAQQVFLSAHRSLLSGAEPREPAAWLATIARNECWARIRGRMREPLASAAADGLAGREDPVAEAIRRADLAALWRAIRALPKPQREALLLREFGGLRYDELAAALAVSEPAVESLLFRARTRLRAQLQSAAAALAPLARVLAGSGGPAVAAKAAAIGLGAAAVTGTAVVAPEVLERHAHPSQTPVMRPLRAVRETAPIAALQVSAVVQHVARAATPPRTEGERHDGGSPTATEAEHHDGGGEAATEPERHDGGGTAATETERHDGGETTTAKTTSSGDGSREQGSGGSGSGGSGSGSSGPDSPGSGDGESGQTIPTATAPVLPTVTLPTVGGLGDSGSGADG